MSSPLGVVANRRREVAALVVDRGVESELVDEIAALRVGTGETDDVEATDARELTRDRADRPASRGDQDAVAWSWLSVDEVAEVGGQARVPEHAQLHLRGAQAGGGRFESRCVRC